MPSCAIITCKTKSQTSSIVRGGISFHRFPKEPSIKEKWIDVTGRENWFPTKNSTICSKHFSENDFVIKKSGNRYLKPGALPRDKIVNIYTSSLTDTQDNGDVTQASCATSTVTLENIEEHKPPIDSLSISSVLDTPAEKLLVLELKKCRRRLKAKNAIITNLRKQNSRLIKRNAVLRSALKILRKQIKLDPTLNQEPTQYIFVCEENE